MTVSIGIAVFDDRENLNGADVIHDADTALYTAKADSGHASLATHCT